MAHNFYPNKENTMKLVEEAHEAYRLRRIATVNDTIHDLTKSLLKGIDVWAREPEVIDYFHFEGFTIQEVRGDIGVRIFPIPVNN